MPFAVKIPRLPVLEHLVNLVHSASEFVRPEMQFHPILEVSMPWPGVFLWGQVVLSSAARQKIPYPCVFSWRCMYIFYKIEDVVWLPRASVLLETVGAT